MQLAKWAVSRQQAEEIWRAGVEAVDSVRLVQQAISVDHLHLRILQEHIPLATLGKLVVVGAGKAGVGMAAGVEAALPREFLQDKVTGWVNVPADCLPEVPLKKIQLHAARPAGMNEPTEAGLFGSQKILERVSGMQPEDVCLVLISGGGSALLPAPVAGVSLAEKCQITRSLSRAGATIEELNLVRRSLSRIKGGGLLRACRAGRLIALIISDVVGDPLPTIASGPTVLASPDPAQAFRVLQTYIPDEIPAAIQAFLQQASQRPVSSQDSPIPVKNCILGSNAVALAAAGERAEKLGYRVLSLGATQTGIAAELGKQLVERALDYPLAQDQQPLCLLCGGETTVPFSGATQTETDGNEPQQQAKGGRNQEVAVAAVAELAARSLCHTGNPQITLLAAGTDGEDGPTDAAGGFADCQTIQRMQAQNLAPATFLNRHDSYHFLQACDSLLITGPTHTNVMDLTITLVHPGGV